MSAHSREIHDWARHERDRTLRATGQAHRYLTDAQFHVAVDLVLRAVQETCEVFALHPLFDNAGADSLEACVRSAVRIIVQGYQTGEDLQRLALQTVEIPPRSPAMQALMDLVDSLPTPRGGIQYGEPT